MKDCNRPVLNCWSQVFKKKSLNAILQQTPWIEAYSSPPRTQVLQQTPWIEAYRSLPRTQVLQQTPWIEDYHSLPRTQYYSLHLGSKITTVHPEPKFTTSTLDYSRTAGAHHITFFVELKLTTSLTQVKMPSVSLLLLSLSRMITVWLSCMMPVCQVAASVSYAINPDKHVAGSILDTKPALSAKHCCMLCTMNTDCGGANYDAATGNCELLAVNQSPVTMDTQTDSSYLCCNCDGAISGTTGIL